LKSYALTIDPGSLNVQVGFTGIEHSPGYLPDVDPFLAPIATVATLAPENGKPVGAAMSAVATPNFVINKTTSSPLDASIYSVSVPLGSGIVMPSSLAYFKFRFKSAWNRVTPTWSDRGNMVAPFFCLEHGPLNTSVTAALWDNGGGGAVLVGGPQTAPSTTRPTQHAFPLIWTTLTNNAIIELWLFFNLYSNPYTVEIWGKLPTDNSPRVLGTFNNFSTFPTPDGIATNTRIGPSSNITLYFGNGGTTGDVVQIDDWAVFPDYRLCVQNGEPLTNTSYRILPDTPVMYSAPLAAQKLNELVPGRWMPLDVLALPSNALPISMHYQPGRSSEPVYVSLAASGKMGGYQKKEPRIETLSEGVMFEAFLAAVSTARTGIGTSLGIGFEDGAYSYKLMLVDTKDYRTIGLLASDSGADVVTGHHLVGSEVDWTTLRSVRLTLDRIRERICIFAEDMDEPVLDLPLGPTAVPSALLPSGRFIVGSLTDLPTEGRLDISTMSYLSRYRAWEAKDVKLPNNVGVNPLVRFTEYDANDIAGTNVMTVNDGMDYLTITKTSFNAGSYRFYDNQQDLGEVKGLLLDFKLVIDSFAVSTSENVSNVDTGVGIKLFLGNKVVHIGFFDCGVYGRRIGIVPGSGTVDDIINQTTIGRLFSASADWYQEQSYRLVIRGFESIQLWVGTPVGAPAVEIAWRNDVDGFDLPDDTTQAGIRFGHMNEITGSVSRWRYLRWGISNGYEVAVQPLFPDGEPDYLFDGRVTTRIEVSD
jgi:hypothetical protein